MMFGYNWLARTALTTTLAAGLLAALAPAPARADEQTVKLIKLLIQKGILSSGQAQDLLRESAAPSSPRGHARTAPAAPADSEETANPAGQIRVTYVPQFIRKQIADQVRAQVMTEAQQEGWAAPNALPEWTQRIKLYGDLRVRYRGDMFDSNNYNQFINFNNLNAGSGFDANNYGVGSSSQTNPGFLNSTENRNRIQLRARIGVAAQIDDWVSANIRIATGNDSTPSPNTTLGNSADFGKSALWLDRAYFTLTPLKKLTVLAGRTPNPYLPSDLMFYPDDNFDGLSAKLRYPVSDSVTLFGTAGGFALYNTPFDYATTNPIKFASTDAFMAALQAGAEWRVRQDVKATLGIGIFDFLGTQGAVSAPCAVQLGGSFSCNTDSTRVPYTQFGNSLYPIRNIVPYQPSGSSANPPDPQYYGLASRFNVLDIHPILDITSYHPFDVRLEGEFLKNLAFNYNAIAKHGAPNEVPGPVNNLGANGHYLGGDTGYMAKVSLGQLEVQKLWDWNVSFAYRYLQSDATLSSIADIDFHEGGTNAQGYVLGGNLGVGHNTWVELKLYSAQSIVGPHYGTDSVFVDMNARF